MILAEIDRMSGDTEDAVARLAAHRDYLLTESSNWQAAMYSRAFPGVVGLLAKAIGVEDVPVHRLRMVSGEDAERAVLAARDSIGNPEIARLASRLGTAQGLMVNCPTTPTPCRVRLFGGLEVTTEFGTVDEDAWRKRKARVLFAMLAVKRGQDVPRDVILEHLWPEMDEARARNNFYVIWSAMKRALAAGEAGPAASRYVQNTGGLCRVTRAVRSDLDEFDDTVAALRSADAMQDEPALLEAARALMEVYRGELLPGDLYDDWFAEVRDRTRHDFCDAMMRAARVVEARGEHDHALVFLRRATLADPWREDVYQTTMRCQMNAGQRSNAIETYLACRSKLVDDLGLDPSAETTRLYEALLAMEDGEPPAAEGLDRYPYAV
jgi:DNA-binding SARP family transcriptional activator